MADDIKNNENQVDVNTKVSKIGGPLKGLPAAMVQEGQVLTGQTPGYPFGVKTFGERDIALEEENKQKMIKSGQLDEATLQNPQLTQEKVNLFTYGVGAPIWGAVDDSGPAQEEVGGIMNQVKSELATVRSKLNTPEYKLYKDYEADINAARGNAKDVYNRLMANIEEDYRIRELEQRDENRVMMGMQSKQLARMGAFGRSGSAMSYLQDVDRTNQRHLNKLLMEKERVLIQATQAYLNQDWAMLTKIMDENKKITDQYNQVQQQMFEDSIMSDEQIMKQARFGWEAEDRQMGKLQQWATSFDSWEQVPMQDRSKFLELTGMTEENARALFESNALASKRAAEFDYVKSVIELQGKVPEGQSFSIGDRVYTGWKESTPSVYTNVETDERGYATLITYNKKTGEVKSFNLGKIASPDKGTIYTDGNGDVWSITPEGAAIPVTATITTQKGGSKTLINPKTTDGFMEWANKIGPITADYEQARATEFETVHMGVDLAAPVGTPLTPLQPGKVIETGYNRNLGNYVQILGDDGFVYQYSHLDSIYVTNGDRVNLDFTFGTVGNTGSVQSQYSKQPKGIVSEEERAQGLGAHLDLRKWIYNEPKQITRTSNNQEMSSGALATIANSVKKLADDIILKGEYSPSRWEEIHDQVYTRYKKDIDALAQGTPYDPREILDTILMEYGFYKEE